MGENPGKICLLVAHVNDGLVVALFLLHWDEPSHLICQRLALLVRGGARQHCLDALPDVEQREREALRRVGLEAAAKLAEDEGRRGVQPLIEGRGVGAGR